MSGYLKPEPPSAEPTQLDLENDRFPQDLLD